MTQPWVSLLLTCSACLVSAPAWIFSGEVVLGIWPSRARPRRAKDTVRTAVIIPAHNESLGIAETVLHIKEQLHPADRLIVIADNCTDDTAEKALAAGAEVLERVNPNERGKGYALSYAAVELGRDPPDVVLIMDADCRVRSGDLLALSTLAHEKNRPVQAVYLMERPRSGGALSGISAFAFLVRNWVRPLGLKRLGFPCLLTGTGMAFPWQLFRDAPATHGFLVEDLLMGHELALLGAPPLLDEAIFVDSFLPEADAASFKQRRRWEHGQLSVLKSVAPRLFGAGLLRFDPGLLALALDATVPPLALLVVLELVSLVVMLGIWLLGGPIEPLLIALGTFFVLTLAVLAAWVARGRSLLTPRELLSIPGYILWKIPLYKTFVRSGAHTEWERTDRS